MAKADQLNAALSPLFGLVTVKVENERTLPDGSKAMVMDKFRNPLAIKTLMAGLGMAAGPTRRPLGEMTANGVAIVRDAARQVWRNNPEILQPISDHYGVDVGQRIEDDNTWAAITACRLMR